MADNWSGAIIYEWIQETNNYGLVEYGPQQDASVNEGSSIVQGFNHKPHVPDQTLTDSLQIYTFRHTNTHLP